MLEIKELQGPQKVRTRAMQHLGPCSSNFFNSAYQSHVETDMFESRLPSGCRRTLGLGSLRSTGQQGAGSSDGLQLVKNVTTYHIRSFLRLIMPLSSG